jgi:hypothetical protein
VVAVFEEEGHPPGVRHNVFLVEDLRFTESTKVRRHRPDAEYGDGVEEMRGQPTVWLTVLDENNRRVVDPSRDPRHDANWRWHYQMRCPSRGCGVNVSTTLIPLHAEVMRLLEAGESWAELIDIARSLGPQKD